jgi:ABC-2 type transport system ATP-binding protein
MSTAAAAISVAGLAHAYGGRPALSGVSFSVAPAEIFGLLGPNGGGKTTLFRILSTLLPIQQGTIHVLGYDVARQPAAVRNRIGVTFQSPSLDRKLTVFENLRHQGHLYGLYGRALHERIAELLERLGLSDRAADRAESLSGGLQRRVEIAKGLLHHPQVLLLDEPSTGLDPGARLDLWTYLERLRTGQHVAILVTTHLMEEAERCDRLAILDRGQLAASGSPAELRSAIGGDCLTIHSSNPADLSQRITEVLGISPQHFGQTLRIEVPRGHEVLRDLVERFPTEIAAITLGKPTLEDVFVQRTGHRFWEDQEGDG